MKKLIALLTALASLMLCGCGSSIFSNYRETEHLQLVQALGADTDADGGVTLSVSCAKPAQSSSGGIISRSGESILRAMRSLQNYSADQQLYYAHTQYLLMGEDYARKSADELFDFAARDTQLRLGLYLFVVREAEARELISGPGEESYEISKTLSSVRRNTKAEGTSHVFTLRETLRSLSESGAALVCALRSADTEGSVFLLEPGTTAVADGYGILVGGQLSGWLDADISQAANLILGHLGSAGPSFPDGRGGLLSLEYDEGSASIRARWGADGSLEGVDIEAKLRANLAEPDTDIEHITDRELLSRLEDALERDMKKKIEAVLEQSRTLNADFLGLKSRLSQFDGEKIDSLGEDWLKKAKFSVSCEAKISYTRELGDKMSSGGEA